MTSVLSRILGGDTPTCRDHLLWAEDDLRAALKRADGNELRARIEFALVVLSDIFDEEKGAS